MSHFTVAVITDQQPSHDDLAVILQPWHEYECTGIDDEYVIDVDVTDELLADHAKYGDGRALDEFAEDWTSAKKADDGRYYRRTNPNAKWDWWQVGGRWTGMLKMKETALAIVGRTAWCAEPAEAGYGDSAAKRDIDIDGMRQAAADKAQLLWDRVQRAISGCPPIEAWDSVRARIPNIDEARPAYWDQPALKALKAAFPDSWSLDQEVLAAGLARDAYVKREADKALTTFAIVKDGQWYEKGKMGWWACVSDERDQEDWSAEYAALLDSLADGAWITIVDCHI